MEVSNVTPNLKQTFISMFIWFSICKREFVSFKLISGEEREDPRRLEMIPVERKS